MSAPPASSNPWRLPPGSPLSTFQMEAGSRVTPIDADIGHRPFATKISDEHPLVTYSSRAMVNEHVRRTWPKERIEPEQGRQLFVDNFLLSGGELPLGLSREWHQATWIEELNTMSISSCVTFDLLDEKERHDGTGHGAEFPEVLGKAVRWPNEKLRGQSLSHITVLTSILFYRTYHGFKP